MTMLAALHSGAACHCETLEGARYASLFGQLIRPEALCSETLAGVRTLLVPCRTHPTRLVPHRDLLRGFVEDGGHLVAMGETCHDQWLDDVVYHPVPTNFWWWLTPGADLGVRIEAPAHPLLAGLTKADVTWHLHGWFGPRPEAEVLVADAEARAILTVEQRGKGRLILTSLDPTYHHGSHFMPATTRFLDRFLPNLVDWT
jgi:hypothetical protein